jgi:hypothetical protein
VVPEFFAEEEQMMAANVGIAGFDANTSLATAHQDIVQRVRKVHNSDKDILGDTPQRVKLPFKCEEDVIHWEAMLFNGDEDVSAASGDQQYFSVLKIDLLSSENPMQRRARGAMLVIGSPVLADHHGCSSSGRSTKRRK